MVDSNLSLRASTIPSRSARRDERQAAAEQRRKRAACQQEQPGPCSDDGTGAPFVAVLIGAHRLLQDEISPIACVAVHAQHDSSDGSVVKAFAAIRMPSAMVT